ncbi:hypothetical protein [Phytohabitans aurantiacus]|jgi:hypothetical protein|uniref:Integral membrane protein n=1 Tax=Phytohabitans aurantiacus TaxID=3016789 RepID=A0ABQ5R2W4_9ACTN|nr:hypothetical protein [Phytohabitans aurantiacus]GLI00881.1 hypothetical protein Pa4123_61570 [Phytohabitans aurantiacus]
MVTATTSGGTARADAAHRTSLAGWVVRAIISAHMIAIVGQPVFAGVYLSGNFDGLRWHAIGADVVTSLGYLQVITAAAVWVQLRHSGLFLTSLAVVAAETVQYFAGMDGALWLHLPLGVLTIVVLTVQFIVVWRQPLRPVSRPEGGDA